MHALIQIVAVALAVCLVRPAGAGVDPATACREKKAKATGKKAADVLKAFGKNEKKPDTLKLGADISKAESKYTKAFDKAEEGAGCLTAGDSGTIEDKVNAFVQHVIASIPPVCGDDIRAGDEICDGTDDSACPGLCRPNCLCPEAACGNGSIEAGEQCDPPCEQGQCPDGEVCNGFCACEPVAPCDCGSPPPAQIRFVQKQGAGICGVTQNATGSTVSSLACGGLFIGSGSGDLPLPVILADKATLTHRVECCNGTSLTLRHTTAADTGDRRTCSAASAFTCSAGSSNPGAACFIDGDCPGGTCERCFYGLGPQPVVNQANIFLSTCLLNVAAKNSTGALDCSTGETFVDYELDANVHLRGVDFSTQPGWQSCPVCVGGTIGVPGSGHCEGGPNTSRCSLTTSKVCGADGDCPATETCILSPCEPGNTKIDLHDCCVGDFLLNGRSCSDDSDCGAGTCAIGACSAFPTSQDCPPPPLNNLGAIPIPFKLGTGTSSQTANSEGTFCGFCRDVDVEGSTCFEGDPDPGGAKNCPDSATIACKPESGTDLSECGDGVRCLSDSGCAAPYETCEQRNPGAFRDASIRFMSATGSTPGDLRDHLPHDATIVDAFCIDSSFTPSIDASSDLPGPGVVILVGDMQMLP